MKKLLLISLLLPSIAVAQNVDLTAEWDSVTASPPVTKYTLYNNGVKMLDATEPKVLFTIDASKNNSLQVSATNKVGESDKSIPLVVARPATPTNLKLKD